MILEFKLKNWMSFRNETVFSMVSSPERHLLARVPQIRKSPVLNIAPAAVLYGGNASGKTNFFAALAFLKNIVCHPIYEEGKEIPVRQYALDSLKGKTADTGLDLTFLAEDDVMYALRITLNRREIVTESLSILKAGGETTLYTRAGNEIKLSGTLAKDGDAQAFARILAKNQLYFGTAGRKVSRLNPAWKWFSSQLILIHTHQSFGGYGQMFSAPTNIKMLGELLDELDTGICRLDMEESSFAAISAMVKGLSEQEILDAAAHSGMVELNFGGVRFVVQKKDGRINVKKMVSYHKNEKGQQVKFELTQESEGSLRLLDILPAFLDMEKPGSEKVYVIDELDRSWHYFLSRRLLGIYLSRCSKKTRTQLIFSTHDLMLMDQDLFRQNEMWLVERDPKTGSGMTAIAEYNVRHDKDLRKLYLQGVLGGVPSLKQFGALSGETEGPT